MMKRICATRVASVCMIISWSGRKLAFVSSLVWKMESITARPSAYSKCRRTHAPAPSWALTADFTESIVVVSVAHSPTHILIDIFAYPSGSSPQAASIFARGASKASLGTRPVALKLQSTSTHRMMAWCSPNSTATRWYHPSPTKGRVLKRLFRASRRTTYEKSASTPSRACAMLSRGQKTGKSCAECLRAFCRHLRTSISTASFISGPPQVPPAACGCHTNGGGRGDSTYSFQARREKRDSRPKLPPSRWLFSPWHAGQSAWNFCSDPAGSCRSGSTWSHSISVSASPHSAHAPLCRARIDRFASSRGVARCAFSSASRTRCVMEGSRSPRHSTPQSTLRSQACIASCSSGRCRSTHSPTAPSTACTHRMVSELITPSARIVILGLFPALSSARLSATRSSQNQ